MYLYLGTFSKSLTTYPSCANSKHMKFIAPLLIVLSLTSCAEAQQTSGQTLTDDAVEKVSTEEGLSVVEASERSITEDYSKMPREERQAEVQRLQTEIDEMEASGANRRDIYMVRKEIVALEKAETAAEEAETAALREALDQSCKLVGAHGETCE